MMIRPDHPADAGAIREVVLAAFADSQHSSGTEAAIVEVLRRAGALAISLVADEDGEVVGHAAFSPVLINNEKSGWFSLGPLAVRPDRQRSGVGQMLIRSGIELLRERQARGCVVLGDPAYYRRFGFRSDPRLCYADVPPGYFQQLSFDQEQPAGAFTYHPAFDVSE